MAANSSAIRDFGKLPVYFTPNAGQIDASVDFYVQGKDKTVYFTPAGVTYSLRDSAKRWTVKMDFVGANPDVKPAGLERTGAVISYFKGKPEYWKAGLPAYSRIIYKDLWPGIDLVYQGEKDKLKYEIIVHPGADPSSIEMLWRGAERIQVDENGRLEIETPAGSFVDETPLAYQESEGRRHEISMIYDIQESTAPIESSEKTAGTRSYLCGFKVGAYDKARDLVLDPATIIYCGYIGGSGDDIGYGIAVDGSGNAYVTGSMTEEGTGPETSGPSLAAGPAPRDVFVAKINASGSALVYLSYIGGSSNDLAYGIAVDGSGNAYVTGYTDSDQTTFPVSGGPDLTHNGNYDAFLAKVKADGTALDYCGYIGGSNGDYGRGIAVDGSGNAYVTGYTYSDETTFPVLVGPGMTHNVAYMDAFVAKVNASGTALVYCGFISGSQDDYGYGIAVDGTGNAYVTGDTSSSETQQFPVTGGPDSTHNGDYDAFLAKVKADGTALDYCGYIGGSNGDHGRGIAVDGSGNAYVTGYTYSDETTFPVLVGPGMIHNEAYMDAFVAKVNATGTALVYCGYISGSQDDHGYGIAVDNSGNAYVTGDTSSSETQQFPVTGGPDSTHNGNYDAFVAKVKADGTALDYCGYIGGSADDYGYGIAVDSTGNVYVTGATKSSQTTFPVTSGPDLTYNGNGDDNDAFVAKISDVAEISVAKSSDNIAPKLEEAFNFTVTVTNNGPLGATGLKIMDSLPAALTYVSSTPSQGTYSSVTGIWDIGTLANAATATLTIAVKGTSSGAVTNTASVSAVDQSDPNSANNSASSSVTVKNTFTLTIAAGAGGTTSPVPGTYTYDEGTVVSISATAFAGYRLGDWTGDASGSTSPISVTMNANKAVTANFIRQYTLTIAAGVGGTTNPFQGTYTYDAGTSVTVDAFPAAGYRFGTWTGDASGSNSQIIITMDANKSITANFIRQYTLTIAAGVGGTTNPFQGTYTYDAGTSVTVDAFAASGYRFGSWTGDASGSNSQIIITMDANKTITANFIRQYTLTIAAGVGGTTSPVPGTYTYDEGTVVSVSATPSAGYRLGNWTGDAVGSTSPITVTMNGNKSVTANFVRQYTLTIAAGAGGTTSPVPGTYTYDEGASVSVSASATAGYRFGGWTGDASGSTSPTALTMNANKTVTANFIRRYTLTIIAGTGGTTNPVPGTYTYDEGAVVNITATASAGYRFGGWTGDASGSTSPIVVTMNADKTITANFIRRVTLTIIAGAGGTTNPVPGTYTYDEGVTVSVLAEPFATYEFEGWGGAASGTVNPAAILMNGNKTVQANFSRAVKAPLGLIAEKLTNRNVSMIEIVARLRWQPNSANTGPISYRIYQIENGQATAIANVGAGTYEYIVRNLQATRSYRFGITAVNSQGWESDMVEIVVQ